MLDEIRDGGVDDDVPFPSFLFRYENPKFPFLPRPHTMTVTDLFLMLICLFTVVVRGDASTMIAQNRTLQVALPRTYISAVPQ